MRASRAFSVTAPIVLFVACGASTDLSSSGPIACDMAYRCPLDVPVSGVTAVRFVFETQGARCMAGPDVVVSPREGVMRDKSGKVIFRIVANGDGTWSFASPEDGKTLVCSAVKE